MCCVQGGPRTTRWPPQAHGYNCPSLPASRPPPIKDSFSSSSDDQKFQQLVAVNRRVLLQTASYTVLSFAFSCGGWLKLAVDDEDWDRVYLPINPGIVLLDISFVPDDPNHGFPLGTRQFILETKVGGNTLVPQSIPSAKDEEFNYRFNSISFNGKEGWIVGKPAILLYTSDAGDTRERIPLNSQLPGDIV